MNFEEQLIKWQEILHNYWVKDLPTIWHYTAEDWIYAVCANKDFIYVGSSSGKLHILNYNGKLQKIIDGFGWINDIILADLNGDGKDEIFIASGANAIHCLDNSGELLWSFVTNSWVYSIDKIIFNDGELGLVAGTQDGRLYLLNSDGKLLNTFNLSARINSIISADVNSDGRMELIIGADTQNIHLLDLQGNEIWTYATNGRVRNIQWIEATKDVDSMILASSYDNRIYALSKDGRLLWSYEGEDHIRNSSYLMDKILAASEDKSLYVLNRYGTLEFRYLAEHRIYTVKTLKEQNAIIVALEDKSLHYFQLKENKFPIEKIEKIQSLLETFPDLPSELWEDNPDRELALGWLSIFHLKCKDKKESKNITLDWFANHPSKWVRRACLVKLIHNQKAIVVEEEILKYLQLGLAETDTWIRLESLRLLAYFLDEHSEKSLLYFRNIFSDLISIYNWENFGELLKSDVLRELFYLLIPLYYEGHSEHTEEADYLKALCDFLANQTHLDYYQEFLHTYEWCYNMLIINNLSSFSETGDKLLENIIINLDEIAPFFTERLKLLERIISLIRHYHSVIQYGERLSYLAVALRIVTGDKT